MTEDLTTTTNCFACKSSLYIIFEIEMCLLQLLHPHVLYFIYCALLLIFLCCNVKGTVDASVINDCLSPLFLHLLSYPKHFVMITKDVFGAENVRSHILLYTSKHYTFTQGWLNVGSSSTSLVQH